MTYHVSETGINLIKRFEGLAKKMADGRIRSYRCPAGRWTIGYGHTKGVRSNQHIDEAQAHAFLLEDIGDCVRVIEKYVKVPLSQNHVDALASFIFNLGEGNFASSTLLKRINAGNFDDVPNQLMRWNKATVDGQLQTLRGLTRRRSAEAALFAMDAPLPAEGAPMPQKVTAASTKKPLTKSRTMWGGGIAAVGALIAAVKDPLTNLLSNAPELAVELPQIADQLRPFTGAFPALEHVIALISFAGAALAIYARWDDYKQGEN